MRRLAAGTIAIVAMAGIVFTAGATAHKVKYDTTVMIKYDKPNKNDPYAKAAFEGSLGSDKARCEKNRTVTVLRREADGSTTPIESAKSDATGTWSIQPGSVAAGTYYAATAKKVLRKNKKHRHVCRKGASKEVKVK